ncbi:unnamed protein product [Psylliodes chrysocephalus]|uniref:C2H2-type domain-containing protein n=1 Tax=Psylliodes chrysocephalus TaxID=3402493 RepID=A0A9P0D1J4_9CUCU|nr:unnamed protein product [Psylliodes chrysocephala]
MVYLLSMMNVKEELLYLHEDVFKTEPDDFTEQMPYRRTPQMCENDVFEEFETGTRRQNVDEIKQEIIECDEIKIEHDSVQENNLQFCPLLTKKELEDISEIKATDIEDIKEDVCEYVHCKAELLTTHCDLQTLKNENTEYPDCLAESCEREEDEKISDPLKNSTNVLSMKNFPASNSSYILDGNFQKSVILNKFDGKSKKIMNSQTNILTHADEKPFKCDICLKEFEHNSGLQKHLITHTNENPFRCNICSKGFNYKSNLKAHLKAHTNKLLTCDSCSKEFPSKSKLQRHLVTHTKEKAFKCDICCKQFAQKYTLKSHLITHTNEKSFKCDICSKAFNYKCILQTHLMTHTNEKPFKCNICSKAFNRKDNLQLHLIIHTNEKPFKCDICSKQFTQKSNFKAHLITHTNKKSFQCDICSKKFTLKSRLQRHLKNDPH